MEMHTQDSLLRVHGIDSSTSSSPRSIGRWLTRLLTRLLERHRKEAQIRRQISELRWSDDRLLRDIGISRWEIEAIVRGGRSAVRGDEGPWR